MSPRVISEASIQEREQELLSISKDLIEQEGIHALTLDKLAANAPYSKGTIYNHFDNKEDLLLSVANECVREIGDYFNRAMQFEGSSRDKGTILMLSYLIWTKLNPTLLFIMLSVHTPAFHERCSAARLERHEQLHDYLMQPVFELMQLGVSSGDLSVPPGMHLPQVSFAIWSTVYGTISLVNSGSGHPDTGGHGVILEREFFNNLNLILDGLNWQPNSLQQDYRATIQKATQSLFASEIKQLEEMGAPLMFNW